VPGAVVLRSDVVRKSLFGVTPTTRLGAEGYTAGVTRQVYETLAARAGEAVRAGHSVIVDAVHRRASERTAIAEVARSAGVPFTGIWLEAPLGLRAGRVDARASDASDATSDLVRREVVQGAATADDWERVDASGTPEQVRDHVVAVLGRARNVTR
jgi:hypothetical protein